MSEDENTKEEEKEQEAEEKPVEPTPRFDPETLGQGLAEKNGDDDASMWMICMEIGFSTMHPM